VFAALGGTGLATRASLSSSCAPFCTDAQVQPVRTRFLAADISLGVSTAAAAAAIVVFVLRPARRVPPATARAKLSVRPAPRGLVLDVGGEL
jgi:hypothetical protein